MHRIIPIILIAAALCAAPHADAEPAAGEASGPAAPPAPTPAASTNLTDSQRTRLATAADRSSTVDEAAFYALLENVRDAPLPKAGAVLPDYAALRADPAAHRGQPVYIEGRLLTATAPLHLSREGFDGVRPFVLQIDKLGKSTEAVTADDMVIVYLAHPSDTSTPTLRLNRDLLTQTGAQVRVVARFYKLFTDIKEDGKSNVFLTFVAHSAELSGKGTDAAEVDRTVRNTILFTVAIAAMLIYWFWRIAGIRRRRRAGRISQVDEYLERRELRRKELAAEIGDDPDDLGDLPDDPVAAMEALKQRRAATAEPPAFLLDNPDQPDDDGHNPPPSQGGAGGGLGE